MYMSKRISKSLIAAAVAAVGLPALGLTQAAQDTGQAPQAQTVPATPPTPAVPEGTRIYRVQPSTQPGQPQIFQMQPGQFEQRMELQTFLGVSTRSLPPEVAPHVNVAEGVGLLVSFVEPDSPAAEAGIEQDDIIVKFDDQWTVNMEQLAVLVRMHEKGDAVTLTLLRRGEQQEVAVTLGEKEQPVGGARGNFMWHVPGAPMAPGAHGGTFHLDPQGPAREELRALREAFGAGGAGADAREAAERARQLAAELRAQLDNQRLELELMRPELLVPNADIRGARVTITNGSLTARLVNENGQSTLTVEDKESDFEYEGPFPSDEEVAEMPENVQEIVEQMKQYASPASPDAEEPQTRPAQEREQVRA